MGSGQVFSSGLPVTFLGYKLLSSTAINRSEGRTIQQLVDDAAAGAIPIRSDNDPRGLFRSGMTPTKQLSYRVYHRIEREFFRPDPSLLISALGISTTVPFNFNITESFTRAAVVCFEGRDVIDLDTSTLTKDGNDIILPDKVYRVLHAGDEPFLGPKDNIAAKSALLYYSIPRASDDQFAKIIISEDAPFDVRQANEAGLANLFVDTMSNRVRLKAPAKFISYVAVDKPIFRDIVFMKQGSLAFLTNGLITSTGAGNGFSYMMRFVPFDIRPSPEAPEKIQWRLSESWNVKIDQKEPLPLSARSLLSQTSIQMAAADEFSNHFVYNLSESTADDVTNDFHFKPTKKGVAPQLAKLKQDSTSPFFEKDFKNTYFDYKLGFGATGGVETAHAIGIGLGDNTLAPEFSFTSPTWVMGLTSKARLGFEYYLRRPTGVNVLIPISENSLLAKSVEAAAGIAVVYNGREACRRPGRSFVYDVFGVTGGSVVTERTFPDTLWTTSGKTVPDSKLTQFLLGEAPWRSEGSHIFFLERCKKIDVSTKTGISVPANTTPQAVSVKFGTSDSDDSSADLAVFGDASPDGDPLFEATFHAGSEIDDVVTIPPVAFQSYKSKKGKISAMYVVEHDKELRQSLKGVAAPSAPPARPGIDSDVVARLSNIQLNQMEATKFPYAASNVSACYDPERRMTVVAFENDGRIDLGVRKYDNAPFAMIRDVALRVPDDFDSGSSPSEDDSGAGGKDKKDLPAATLPFVLNSRSLNKIFLFYVYKNALIVKPIPVEVLQRATIGTDGQFAIEAERQLVEGIHATPGTIIYEASGQSGNQSKDTSALKVDLKLFLVAYANGARLKVDSDKREAVSQYSACMMSDGYVFMFIQTGDKLRYMRSSDQCGEWHDILPAGFKLLPKRSDVTGEDTANIVDAPSCYASRGDIMLFFFHENSLLYMKFASETLRRDAATNQAKLEQLRASNKFLPTHVVGPASESILKRGIPADTSVLDFVGQDKKPIKLSPHRVAGHTTIEGYHRVFFKDDKQALRSIVSTNSGNNFLSEKRMKS